VCSSDLWPRERLARELPNPVPKGYEIRTWDSDDVPAYIQLMVRAGFPQWADPQRLITSLERCLPNGIFLVIEQASGCCAATATAWHHPLDVHPFGGELAWVAADPDHRGKGLGAVASTAALVRLVKAGYEEIYLRTDDDRLPAIKTYLKLGWQPYLYAEGMAERWREVCRQLDWKCPATEE
jgi:mycothiol synthase